MIIISLHLLLQILSTHHSLSWRLVIHKGISIAYLHSSPLTRANFVTEAPRRGIIVNGHLRRCGINGKKLIPCHIHCFNPRGGFGGAYGRATRQRTFHWCSSCHSVLSLQYLLFPPVLILGACRIAAYVHADTSVSGKYLIFLICANSAGIEILEEPVLNRLYSYQLWNAITSNRTTFSGAIQTSPLLSISQAQLGTLSITEVLIFIALVRAIPLRSRHTPDCRWLAGWPVLSTRLIAQELDFSRKR